MNQEGFMWLTIVWVAMGAFPTYRLWLKEDDLGTLFGLFVLYLASWYLGPIAYYIQYRILR